MDVSLKRGYEAARSGAIMVDLAAEGRIRATGRDRLDLLHRMSTNDLTDMRPGEARPTVLTTAIARIVDLVWVLNCPDDVLMLTSAGQAENVRRWLSRYIFFQDQVRFENVSAIYSQFGLFGPDAPRVAEALVPGARQLQQDNFATQADITALRARPLAGDGYLVVAPVESIEDLSGRAQAAGAVAASEATYQVLRIEAGVPYVGHELTEGYIPLEANLWSAVSFTKGCYIGQEIIARMESRGRLAKTLVGLKLQSEAPTGADVRRNGASIGTVTSTAVSPGSGPIALAFVKPLGCEPGTQVEVNGISAEIVAFPLN
jgi:aminomethyltransferase